MRVFPRKLKRLVSVILGITSLLYFITIYNLPSTEIDEEPTPEEQGRPLALREALYKEYATLEPNRTGPGEGGAPVSLSPEERALVVSELKQVGSSKYLNSLVSLDRALPDYRPDVCQSAVYPEDLPSVSVVVIFCDELLWPILRTVHSVINRTPPRYLKEVVLVDDASTHAELGAPLESHIGRTWHSGLVKLLRLGARSGLIRTRMAGVRAASGDVVVMVDAHMEATRGWVEPILARIKENNKILIAPHVDSIEAKDLGYIATENGQYQSFKWNMEFWWQRYGDWDPLKPKPSFALVGCAMAMHRQTFLDMGGYDMSMDVWGGENVELPFRVWMCGGRVEIMTCSRFAHMYRAGFGRPWNTTDGDDYFGRNTQRIAEIWLDDYKEQYYIFYPNLKGKSNYGNISERVQLKKRLGCENFEWFLNNIVQPTKFLFNVNVTAWGQVRSQAGAMCLDMLGVPEYDTGPIGVYPCQIPRNQNQVSSHDNKHQWTYDEKTANIVHAHTNLCLDWKGGVHNGLITYVILARCDGDKTQQWIWENYLGNKP